MAAQGRRVRIVQAIAFAALACGTLAAEPLRPAAGDRSLQQSRITVTVQVTRRCKASFGFDAAPRIRRDCDDRDREFSSFTGDLDTRRTYRIERDEINGLDVVEF